MMTRLATFAAAQRSLSVAFRKPNSSMWLASCLRTFSQEQSFGGRLASTRNFIPHHDLPVGGLPGGVVEAGIDVGFFQIREVLEDFLRGHSARKQLEDLAHCDSHPADRGLPAADIGTDRDSLDQHASIMLQVVKKIKGLARFNSSGGGYAFAQAL